MERKKRKYFVAFVYFWSAVKELLTVLFTAIYANSHYDWVRVSVWYIAAWIDYLVSQQLCFL